MKNFWISQIDSFLFEKRVNEWLSPLTIKDYLKAFNLLIDNPYIDPVDFSTYTEMNAMNFK